MGDARADKIPIYAGDVVKKKKPSPDVYLLAAEKMGLEPAKCVVIEDSSIGLAAGKAAGMNVIVTKSSYARRENLIWRTRSSTTWRSAAWAWTRAPRRSRTRRVV